MQKFVKDPSAILDYTWRWDDFLAAGETIESHTVVSDHEELEIDSTTADGTTVTAWMSGGLNEQRCLVTCHIVTTADREDDRSVYILVLNQ